MLAVLAFKLLLAVLVSLSCVLLGLRLHVSRALRTWRRTGGRMTVGFLHPYCNDGGGGERVLWVAIRELIARGLLDPVKWRIVVYTGDTIADDEIRANAKRRFDVEVPEVVEFVRLTTRKWIEPKRYPVATLLGQAFGSLILAAEAVYLRPAELVVDTTGLHFCLPLLRTVGIPKLACYVHYPLISSDMLGAVAARKAAHNNSGIFARFAFVAALKLIYYRGLVALYQLAGRQSDCTMANGSWTAAHLRTLWGGDVKVVYPPCDTRSLQELPIEPEGKGRSHVILSVAQFRPEKDHAKQLEAFAELMSIWRAMGSPAPRPKLVLAGAVRHDADQARLDTLITLAESLLRGYSEDEGCTLSAIIEFKANLPYSELRELLGTCKVGLHTMWNEHFGIGVVEMLAAGVVPIAHNSGGPALDIVQDGLTGRLATTAEQYAEAMAELLVRPDADERRRSLAVAGRASVASKFSETAFAEAMLSSMQNVTTN